MIMTEVLYICLWYKDKKRTWSGTAWSLRQAMEPYLQVQDLALSDLCTAKYSGDCRGRRD